MSVTVWPAGRHQRPQPPKVQDLAGRAGLHSMHQPTAHTRFNTLLPPEYGSRVKTRVPTAISDCTSFGLERGPD